MHAWCRCACRHGGCTCIGPNQAASDGWFGSLVPPTCCTCHISPKECHRLPTCVDTDPARWWPPVCRLCRSRRLARPRRRCLGPPLGRRFLRPRLKPRQLHGRRRPPPLAARAVGSGGGSMVALRLQQPRTLLIQRRVQGQRAGAVDEADRLHAACAKSSVSTIRMQCRRTHSGSARHTLHAQNRDRWCSSC